MHEFVFCRGLHIQSLCQWIHPEEGALKSRLFNSSPLFCDRLSNPNPKSLELAWEGWLRLMASKAGEMLDLTFMVLTVGHWISAGDCWTGFCDNPAWAIRLGPEAGGQFANGSGSKATAWLGFCCVCCDILELSLLCMNRAVNMLDAICKQCCDTLELCLLSMNVPVNIWRLQNVSLMHWEPIYFQSLGTIRTQQKQKDFIHSMWNRWPSPRDK